jgi:hypothetical protein
MYRDTANVEHQVYDYTSSNWKHRNGKKKGLKENLEATQEKHSVYSLQKTAVLGTSYIIWKVLQCET